MEREAHACAREAEREKQRGRCEGQEDEVRVGEGAQREAHPEKRVETKTSVHMSSELPIYLLANLSLIFSKSLLLIY